MSTTTTDDPLEETRRRIERLQAFAQESAPLRIA